MDDASLIHREPTVSGSARYVSAVLAQIGGFNRHLQLKLAVRRYGELAAAGEGFPGVATRQFHVQAAGNYVHDFQLGGAELVFTWRHDADRGRAFSHVERDGFDVAVEVLVYLEHLGAFAGLEKGRQYAQAPGLASPGMRASCGI